MDAGGEIAILVVGSVVTSVGPWLLEKGGVTFPRIALVLLGWVSIAAFCWAITKLIWIAAPKRLWFVTISGPGLIIVCFGICFATLWGCKLYWPPEPEMTVPSETDPTVLALDTDTILPREDGLALKPEHPRLKFSVGEPGEGAIVGIILENIGGSDAINVHIADFEVGSHTITFPIIETFEHGDTTFPLLPRVSDFGQAIQNCLGMAMIEGWLPVGKSRVLPIVRTFPGTAIYSDRKGNHFRASWEYKFYPHKYRDWVRKGFDARKELLASVGNYLVLSTVTTERIKEWAES